MVRVTACQDFQENIARKLAVVFKDVTLDHVSKVVAFVKMDTTRVRTANIEASTVSTGQQ
jgi:hypothetical protein